MEREEPRAPAHLPRALAVARGLLEAAGRRLADLVVPPVCLACRAPLGSHDALCAMCWRQIAFIRPPLCDRLGIPMPFDSGGTMISAAAAANPPVYDRARAVARFDGVMRRLVHELKYADRLDARHLFARWLADAGRDLLADAHVLVPVPLHRWRLLHRRFNQAALLAQEVSRRSGIAYEPLVLQRTRKTPTQVGMTHDERRRNVAAAFAVDPSRKGTIAGRNVVLVDDVITTGATVSACARVLKSAGAGRVEVLALGLVTDEALINP
jgi:ComF family protein